ncbi:leucyl-trna synthetase [Holotrichia oblita]|nr:leucyl-trna synthetase [Holotrichia oblita]
MENFNYSKATDEKWQKKWRDTALYKFDEAKIKNKFYLLEMFSYPSGKNLHIGHWWNYGLSDSYGRFKRMQGYQVFHPPGFDAFGLPAENYAIKAGVHPADSTEKNIAVMEEQFRQMGTTYDWDYEIVTCREEYYKWTQWLFLKLYENGLAYRKEAPVNWCPSCMTVLANEQAAGGKCERCENEIEHRSMTQWFFKITEYADELLSTLDKLDWPENTKLIQKNWIGKSSGTRIDFTISGENCVISVFTTRPDTIMGVSYIVIAPEHPLTERLTISKYAEAVKDYCKNATKRSEIERTSNTKEKTGVFTGTYAKHPITEFKPNGQSPLKSCPEFINTHCPICGKNAKMETDTLDTFVCSSWYFLRFYDVKNINSPFDKKRTKQIMPVDKYVGGVEHASMHLLYARFITKALRDMGYLEFDEPFPSLFHQGIITGKDGKKMSKRDGAVSPDVFINKYGSDVFRMYLGFGFSYIDGGPWDDDGIKAIVRFVARISGIIDKFIDLKNNKIDADIKSNEKLEYARHYAIKQIGNDLELFRFNSAIARIMEYCNAIKEYQKSGIRNWEYEEKLIKDLILLLAPLAPHLSEELWEYIGCEYSVHKQSFPNYDEAKLVCDIINIVIQINGRFKEVIPLPRGMSEDEIKSAALSNSKIKSFINGRKINEIIYVKDRLVNIVCGK